VQTPAPKKPNPFLAFITEHWPLVAGIVAIGALYLFVSSFAELSYGALRLGIVVLVGFLVVHLVFKSTLRPYINTGALTKDFEALNAKDKVWVTLGVIAFILFIATECFTHAAATDVALDSPSAQASASREAMQTTRWKAASVRPEKVHFVDATVAEIRRSKVRYEAVQNATGVPWFVIASIHNMECGLSFREHLHNGDPLIARTRHVPAGRLPEGAPPFKWEDSAIDALRLDGLDREAWETAGGALQNVEAYNGTGYERFHPGVPTPYLWSWTTIYTRGKYIADGRWDPCAISGQGGVAAVWKRMIAMGDLD
jgi:lysozyme family protein